MGAVKRLRLCLYASHRWKDPPRWRFLCLTIFENFIESLIRNFFFFFFYYSFFSRKLLKKISWLLGKRGWILFYYGINWIALQALKSCLIYWKLNALTRKLELLRMEGIVNVNGSSWVDEGSTRARRSRVCLAFTPLGKSITHRVTTFCFYGHARRISCRACTRPRSRLLSTVNFQPSNNSSFTSNRHLEVASVLIIVRSILTIYIKEKLIISSFSIFHEQNNLTRSIEIWAIWVRVEIGRKISEKFDVRRPRWSAWTESSKYRGSSHAL